MGLADVVVNVPLPGKPFSMAADLIGDAARDMKSAADALTSEPLTVPGGISRAARKAHRDLERLRTAVETMRLSGPVVLCGECGRRLRPVAHDEQRETWTGECWRCEVRSTLTAAGDVLDSVHAPPPYRPGVTVHLNDW